MSKKDWTGNDKSVFTCLGASNHVIESREVNDYYATEPIAAELLLQIEPELNNIWECACGEGHLAKVFGRENKLKRASDIIYRGYGEGNIDFFKEIAIWQGDIVTNPPYKYAKEFVEHALKVIESGRKVCMFLKLTFLEGKARKELFKKYPPKIVYVSSSRICCAKNGDFNSYPSSALAYAWFIWEKGYNGATIIKWIN